MEKKYDLYSEEHELNFGLLQVVYDWAQGKVSLFTKFWLFVTFVIPRVISTGRHRRESEWHCTCNWVFTYLMHLREVTRKVIGHLRTCAEVVSPWFLMARHGSDPIPRQFMCDLFWTEYHWEIFCDMLTLQSGVTSAARHSENITCHGVTSTARHAALSHSFDYISTT